MPAGPWEWEAPHLATSFERDRDIARELVRMDNELREAAILESILEQLCGPLGRVPGHGRLLAEIRLEDTVSQPFKRCWMLAAPVVTVVRAG